MELADLLRRGWFLLFILVLGAVTRGLSRLLFDWTIWQFLAAQVLILYVAFLFGAMVYIFFEESHRERN